jgi:hypothetical protein
MDAARDITIHDLKLLSIGYYIQGGIATFYTVMVAGYVGFMGTMLAAFGATAQRNGQKPIPEFVIPLITGIFVVVTVFSLSIAICLLLAGYWLRRYRNKLFIYIVAGLSCLSVPYGTVLGVFTFMVLRRPEAEQLFGGALPQPPALPGAPH